MIEISVGIAPTYLIKGDTNELILAFVLLSIKDIHMYASLVAISLKISVFACEYCHVVHTYYSFRHS